MDSGLALGGEAFVIVLATIFAVPTVTFAALAWRFGSWALIAAAVWSLLNLLLNTPFIIPALRHVNSFFDFGLGLPLIVALIVATVGGIVAFVQRRRGTARTVSTGGERRSFVAITVVVVGLMALSGVLHLTQLTPVSASDKVGSIEVDMKGTEFHPTTLLVSASPPARFVVKNSDLLTHTFTIKQLDIDLTTVGGSEKLIELPAAAAGTYEYTCEIPGHGDMKGTLEVTG